MKKKKEDKYTNEFNTMYQIQFKYALDMLSDAVWFGIRFLSLKIIIETIISFLKQIYPKGVAG